ncbi:MAG: hypothetical protein WC972_10135 [Trueperaceae bacterium]|jgi:hypothetical protein|nr:hypothetical protein [Truepera sp.]HRQ10794.1 hypothetical protein [Trueperaceae bacterium]
MFGLFRRQDPRFREDPNALFCQVRTDRNGEIIHVRLSKTSEMSLQGNSYFVRKALVGPNTLDNAVLEVTMTRAHKVTLATVDGGSLLPVRDWE